MRGDVIPDVPGDPERFVGPELSIVSIALNDREGLARTRASVCAQGPQRCEHIIVDGGSTDGTALDLEKYERDGAQVFVEPTLGIYESMNLGARRSAGRYLLFLNSGDELAERAGAAIVDAVRREPAPTWIVMGATRPVGCRRVLIKNIPHNWTRHALGFQPHSHQSTLIRSDVFKLLGGYRNDIDFVADYDLIMRVGLIEPPFEDPTPIALYEGGGISERRGRDIPFLLHRARVRTFGLTGVALRGSLAVAGFQRVRGDIHRFRLRRMSPRT